jgi:putative hydrolase of HD superfamily
MTFLTENERLTQQIAFIVEIDKLKAIMRRSYLINGERLENTAEHSWHLAMLALILAEHANKEVDVLHVLKMVIVHDIVEIDAGDTFLFDTVGALDKAAREQVAADRLFGLLPKDQADELRQLWNEFEAHETAESHFANALDRLIPLLINYGSGGRTWQENGIISSQIEWVHGRIGEGSAALAELSRKVIETAVAEGLLSP